MEVYTWILTGVVGFILPILIIIASGAIRRLNQHIADFVEEIQELNINNARNIEQIKTLYVQKDSTDRKIDDHENRIRKIETEHAGRTCK